MRSVSELPSKTCKLNNTKKTPAYAFLRLLARSLSSSSLVLTARMPYQSIEGLKIIR